MNKGYDVAQLPVLQCKFISGLPYTSGNSALTKKKNQKVECYNAKPSIF